MYKPIKSIAVCESKWIFGVVYRTLKRWIQASADDLPELSETLDKCPEGDGLKLDELWSYVFMKHNKCWGLLYVVEFIISVAKVKPVVET